MFVQMGTCVHCKSQVPFNTDKCLICEADIAPQNKPMASVSKKILCTQCGTGNPGHLATCVACEARLPVNSAFVSILELKCCRAVIAC